MNRKDDLAKVGEVGVWGEVNPVAHVYLFDKAGRPLVAWDNAKDIKLGDRLYVAPKQWVGLTDEEIQDLSYLSQKIDASNSEWFDRWGFARAIEAKLKEKNT
jgi:hypothetical protein